MRRLQRTALTVLLIIGLIAASGVAWAQTDEDAEPEDSRSLLDTLFNFGYDAANRVFLWNTSQLDGPYDCTLENGPLTATYGETGDDGVILVDTIEDGAGVVMFPNRPPEEVADDQEPAQAPIAYSGADGECGLSGGDPTGPAGQVNHGMFMRLFNSLYQGEGQGRGCLVRHLAQSDLGKGDQQVQVGDVVVTDPVAQGDTGSVEFTTVESDCEHGRAAGADTSDESLPPGNGGRPDDAGRPDHAGKPDEVGPPSGAGGPGNGNGNGNGNGGGPGN